VALLRKNEVSSQSKVNVTEQEINEPQKTDDTAADDEGELDPEQAAQLIKQTSRQAKRQFELITSPWVTLLGAAAWPAVYGTLWLSVRGQHPYAGPSRWALLIVFPLLFVLAGTASVVSRRARQGVSGRSRRRDAYIEAAMASAYAAAFVSKVRCGTSG
jgi:cation transport ATPase